MGALAFAAAPVSRMIASAAPMPRSRSFNVMESSGIDVERQLAGRSGIVRRSAKFGGLCTLSDTLLSCFSRRIRFPQCAYGSLQCAGGIRMINLFNLIEQADLDTDLKLEALSNAHRATAAERYILAGIFGSPAMWQLAGE